MLVSVIRRSIAYNLRRAAACVIFRNETKIIRYRNESNLLSTATPLFAASRIYSTERDSQQHVTLPMLVQGPYIITPSFITLSLIKLKLLYVLIFEITSNIDKEFDVADVLQGARHALIVISKALTNKDFESLKGLVSEDMIEILDKKIKTLSYSQRQLIEINSDESSFVLYDIVATTGNRHSTIEITTIGYYIPGIGKIRNELLGKELAEIEEILESYEVLAYNYKFTRKYVNNIGGPWIATFVNHFSIPVI